MTLGSRILRMLDPEKISGIILKIMRDRIDVVDEILPIDGKKEEYYSRCYALPKGKTKN